MIFGIGFDVINVENKIQLSISIDTKVGQKIALEGDEKVKDTLGTTLETQHPTHNFLVNTGNNYFLLNGSIKVRYEWKDGDVFTDDNWGTLKAILEQDSDFNRCTYTSGSGFAEGVTTLGTAASDWKEPPMKYEPDCSKKIVEIMEDETIVLCPMQHETGWSFKKADVVVGGSITATKEGTDCFVVFGQDCEIGGAAVSKNSIKKLTSSSITVENKSNKLCRLVKIYK